MIRKIALFLCAVSILISFTSCNMLDSDIDELISPPKQDGYTYPIQQALEASVGEKLTLKYPISGDYRSAFTLKDIDGDGVEEAVALYSLNSDNTVSMHLNVIDYENGEWISRSDVDIAGNGVEKIEFCDLNNDNIPEIIVGWMIYGTVDKEVGIYTYDGKALNQRAMEKYTDFLVANLRSKEKEDFIVINLNSTEKSSTLKVLELNDKGIAETGSVILDGGATSYSAPILSTLADGRPALLIDAVKGNGTLTEIVWFEGDALKSVFDPTLSETVMTYRPSTLTYLTDIDNDLIPEIPTMSLLLSTANKPDAEQVYVTKWSRFDGKKLKTIANTFMNYTDGYYLTVPEKWLNKIYLARQPDLRQRIFYGYDAENDLQGDELFRIIAVTKEDIDSQKVDLSGYTSIAESGDIKYFVRVSENNSFGIDAEFIRSIFKVI